MPKSIIHKILSILLTIIALNIGTTGVSFGQVAENFDSLIKKADSTSYFRWMRTPNIKDVSTLNTSISYYQKALLIKPNNEYASQRIIEINRIIKTIYQEEEYTTQINKADFCFNCTLFDSALVYYTEANLVKSTNYSRGRIYQTKRIIEAFNIKKENIVSVTYSRGNEKCMGLCEIKMDINPLSYKISEKSFNPERNVDTTLYPTKPEDWNMLINRLNLVTLIKTKYLINYYEIEETEEVTTLIVKTTTESYTVQFVDYDLELLFKNYEIQELDQFVKLLQKLMFQRP